MNTTWKQTKYKIVLIIRYTSSPFFFYWVCNFTQGSWLLFIINSPLRTQKVAVIFKCHAHFHQHIQLKLKQEVQRKVTEQKKFTLFFCLYFFSFVYKIYTKKKKKTRGIEILFRTSNVTYSNKHMLNNN